MPDQTLNKRNKDHSQNPNDSDNITRQNHGEKSGTGQNYSGGTGSHAVDQNPSESTSGRTGSPDAAGKMHSEE